MSVINKYKIHYSKQIQWGYLYLSTDQRLPNLSMPEQNPDLDDVANRKIVSHGHELDAMWEISQPPN